jgi:molybdopterin/thiamine biosynthesis adenylyltransferase/rhodanese-related sulfurtransferase
MEPVVNRFEDLTHDEIRRYSRHLIMPEVGMDGQRRLKAASVLLVGTGGLGSPLALYLAAAGVGRIGLIDYDTVDDSNLHRQVIHGESSVGMLKVESAKRRLLDLNPHINIVTYNELLTSDNALRIMEGYDIVIDGTDNFPTRYLVNDACVKLGIPNVYGSILRFEGQLSVFYAKEGPPPPGLVPSCAEAGVLGVLPGTIGTMQATEGIKLITGVGEPMIGRMLLYDAAEMTFTTIKVRKNPNCPVCSIPAEQVELIDYEQFCGIPQAKAREEEEADVPHVEAKELKAMLDRGDKFVLVDVREAYEWDICNIPSAKLLPLGQLPSRMSELDSADEIVLLCKNGARSARALHMLREAGFAKLANVRGGIEAWAEQVDPSVPKY